MIGRRAVIGLVLLSTLALCALVAQGASAAKSITTTAFTCVPSPSNTGDFKDPHCDETGTKGKEAYKHEPISLNTTTEVDVTDVANPILKGTLSKVPTEIECGTVKNITKNSTVHNVEPSEKQHTVTGTFETEFSNCTVKAPAKCAVAQPIVLKATMHGVDELEGPKGEKDVLGLEFVGDAAEETFAEVELKNKGAESCLLNGQKFKLKGSMIATSGPGAEEAQNGNESGATLLFTPKFKMQNLQFGTEPAELSTTLTTKMAGEGNPIAFTALTTRPSSNTTAVTCVAVTPGTGSFEDAHCDKTHPELAGNYGHQIISAGTETEFDLTSEKVTNETKDAEPAIFKFLVGLAKVELECTTVKNNVENSEILNTQPQAAIHTFTGTSETILSNCNVKLLAKCVISEPLVLKATIQGVEGIEGPKGEKNAMGLKFVGDGESETFGALEFKNKGAETCSLNGKVFKIQGSMIATGGPTTESAQENKGSGATLVFTPKFKMQSLKVGANSTEFFTVATPVMAGGGNPIALTTTT